MGYSIDIECAYHAYIMLLPAFICCYLRWQFTSLVLSSLEYDLGCKTVISRRP